MSDSALRELVGPKESKQVNVTIHEGGNIVITPMQRVASAADTAKSTHVGKEEYETFRTPRHVDGIMAEATPRSTAKSGAREADAW